jgi:spore germination protein YaaH
LLVGALIIFNSLPIFAFASHDDDDKKQDLEVAGWIPYWNDSKGIKDAKKHIDSIDVIYPFSYEAQSDGTIKDMAGMDSKEWKSFMKSAKRKDVEIIPSILWNDGGAIHANLSYKSLRTKHIDNIVEIVEDNDYDGIDIDYESKLSTTKDHFSDFLKELNRKLDGKILTCTVEARTPPDSLYKNVPAVLEYANDYEAMNKYCDRVEIMAYDQQRADLKLNEEKAGEPYMPVSDVDWVEKVVKLALQDFDEDKVVLGIPTYGYHYDVTVAPNWYKDYKRVGALNVPDLLDIADTYNVTPGRNKAGEMSFTYFPAASPYRVLSVLPVPEGTRKGHEAAAQALLYANLSGQTVTVRYASYSDAGAMEDKIDLAKEYGLRGIALFKIDSEEDQDVWDILE